MGVSVVQLHVSETNKEKCLVFTEAGLARRDNFEVVNSIFTDETEIQMGWNATNDELECHKPVLQKEGLERERLTRAKTSRGSSHTKLWTISVVTVTVHHKGRHSD